MDTATPSMLPLLRLLQVTDSAFPVGGYAYSHGLEWLVQQKRVTGERDLEEILSAFVTQAVARQYFPAAVRAYRVRSAAGAARIDHLLDASITAEAEREAGRAMGERLVSHATEAFFGGRTFTYLGLLRTGEAPGQFAIAFALVARDSGVAKHEMLAALGSSLVSSLTQAAIRLGVIGAAAGTRLLAGQAPSLDRAISETVAARRPPIGAMAPWLETASTLQPTLTFRMFAS